MSVLEELKNSIRESLDARGAELERLLAETWTKKENNETQVREELLAFLSQVRTIYEATVAQAREAESVNEVAPLWQETRAFYAKKFSLWEGLKAQWRSGPENELFVYTGNLVKKLEAASAEQYEFHASSGESDVSERRKTRLTAVFEACEEGGFHAFIPEIKGVHSQGETLEEATDNLADALAQTFAYKVEQGLAKGVDVPRGKEVVSAQTASESARQVEVDLAA